MVFCPSVLRSRIFAYSIIFFLSLRVDFRVSNYSGLIIPSENKIHVIDIDRCIPCITVNRKQLMLFRRKTVFYSENYMKRINMVWVKYTTYNVPLAKRVWYCTSSNGYSDIPWLTTGFRSDNQVVSWQYVYLYVECHLNTDQVNWRNGKGKKRDQTPSTRTHAQFIDLSWRLVDWITWVYVTRGAPAFLISVHVTSAALYPNQRRSFPRFCTNCGMCQRC